MTTAGITVRILLADDHAMFCGLMQTVLELHSDLSVVGQTRNGDEIVHLTKTLLPDVVIMDLVMSSVNGLEVLKELREFCPQVRVLILTGCQRSDYVRRAMEAGVSGVLFKQMPEQELLCAVRTVAAGGAYFDRALSRHWVGQMPESCTVDNSPKVPGLSNQDEQVLRLSAQGFSQKDIAERIDLTAKAVEMSKARALRKLKLTTRHDLVVYALREGWLESGPKMQATEEGGNT